METLSKDNEGAQRCENNENNVEMNEEADGTARRKTHIGYNDGLQNRGRHREIQE